MERKVTLIFILAKPDIFLQQIAALRRHFAKDSAILFRPLQLFTCIFVKIIAYMQLDQKHEWKEQLLD